MSAASGTDGHALELTPKKEIEETERTVFFFFANLLFARAVEQCNLISFGRTKVDNIIVDN
jgi:hypothetical protein